MDTRSSNGWLKGSSKRLSILIQTTDGFWRLQFFQKIIFGNTGQCATGKPLAIFEKQVFWYVFKVAFSFLHFLTCAQTLQLKYNMQRKLFRETLHFEWHLLHRQTDSQNLPQINPCCT